MDHTQNLNLPQWDAEDRILRTDFNAAMSAIDTAAGTAGNCRVAFGTYTGTGTHGVSGRNTLTFSFPPRLVIVSYARCDGTQTYTPLVLFRDDNADGNYYGAPIGADNYSYRSSASWNGNSVSWYCELSDQAQCNVSGHVYSYMALG